MITISGNPNTDPPLKIRGFDPATDCSMSLLPNLLLVFGEDSGYYTSTDADAIIFNWYNSLTIYRGFSCIVNAPLTTSFVLSDVSGSPSPIDFDPSTGIASVNSYGYAGAWATVQVVARQGTRRLSAYVSRWEDITNWTTFGGFVSASPEDNLCSPVDTAIADLTAQVPNSGGSGGPQITSATNGYLTQSVYSAINSDWTSVTRNISSFLAVAGVDLTFYSGSPLAAVGPPVSLVSPHFGICAAHAGTPGSAIFVDNDNNIYRSAISSFQDVGSTDIRVVMLDTPMGASIAPAKVMPTGFESSLPSLSYGVAAVKGSQFQTLTVTEITAIGEVISYGNPVGQSEASAARQPWYAMTQSGDSGSPLFVIVDGAPVLLGALHGFFNAPNLAHYADDVNSAMESLWSAAHLSPPAETLTAISFR